MSLTRRAVLAATLALPLAGAALAQDTSIFGNYLVDGMNSDGSRYEGTVQVSPGEGETIRVDWSIGGTSYTGIGLTEGRVLAVDWGGDAPAVYVIMPFGELHGTWDGGRALERWHGR